MPSRAKKVLKWTAITIAVVVLSGGGLGIYVYTLIPKPIGEKPVLQAELFNKPATEFPVAGKFI